MGLTAAFVACKVNMIISGYNIKTARLTGPKSIVGPKSGNIPRLRIVNQVDVVNVLGAYLTNARKKVTSYLLAGMSRLKAYYQNDLEICRGKQYNTLTLRQ